MKDAVEFYADWVQRRAGELEAASSVAGELGGLSREEIEAAYEALLAMRIGEAAERMSRALYPDGGDHIRARLRGSLPEVA